MPSEDVENAAELVDSLKLSFRDVQMVIIGHACLVGRPEEKAAADADGPTPRQIKAEPKSDEDYVATANPFAKRKRDTEKNGANTDEADTDGAAKPSAMRKRKRGTEKDGVDADDAVADDTGDLFSNAGTDDAADANGN